MNYGMYIAASGASTQMARQDVFSNNLANVSTVGFKPDWLGVRARDVVRIEDGLPFADSNELLERLGAGVMPTRSRVRLDQGALTETGGALDVGLDGEGFLVARQGAGEAGLRLTRDGRLAIASDGTLVMAGDGSALEGEGGPIRVDPRRALTFREDGAVVQGGAVAGRLRIVEAADPSRLLKAGTGMLRAPDGETLALRPAGGRLVQGSLEQSGVNPISPLMGITGASRAAQSNLRMVSIIDDNIRTAINQFGRVA